MPQASKFSKSDSKKTPYILIINAHYEKINVMFSFYHSCSNL